MSRRFQFSVGRLLVASTLFAVAGIIAGNGDSQRESLIIAGSLVGAGLGSLLARGMELAVAPFLLGIFLGAVCAVIAPEVR
jgi:NAD/NADP transhydrogenase beta subunit